ncbi:hypothetical protein BC332_30226 [Capsicum chinense]|nr:hypothetical protein BC332_30226 [Capsicum chinense]
MAILSAKKLIKMARGWQKFAAMQRRKISFTRNGSNRQLLVISEEEFGLSSAGPITLPCDSAFMDYTILLIKKAVAVGDLHKALLLSIPSCFCSTSSWQQESQNQQLLAYGFTLFREVQHEMKKENAVLETFAVQITWKIEMDKMNIYRQSLIRIQNHPQKAKVVLNQITPEKYKQNIIPWRK